MSTHQHSDRMPPPANANGASDVEHQTARFLRSRGGVVAIGFLLVAAFFLLTEHRVHLLGYLPVLIILACPLMHIFMHHGHHAQRGPSQQGNGSAEREKDNI